jgi:hypothetical protein
LVVVDAVAVVVVVEAVVTEVTDDAVLLASSAVALPHLDFRLRVVDVLAVDEDAEMGAAPVAPFKGAVVEFAVSCKNA